MRFSICREDITPDWQMRMAGYRLRVKPFDGVYDRLYATSLLLDDGQRRALLIAIDVCMIDRRFADTLKARIRERYGLDEDGIVLHAIHTHAAPVVMLPANRESTPDYADIEKYRKLLEEKILLSVGECVSTLREGSLEIGEGETYIGMNRRQKKPEGVVIGPNPTEEIDRKAYAAVIRNGAGTVEAVLFSCSCHPVVLYPRNTRVSADYPGAARAEIEKRFPGATAMFVQGPGADVNPAVLTADDAYRDTFYSDVLLTGRILANDVCAIMRGGMKPQRLRIAAAAGKVVLPLSGKPKTQFTQRSGGDVPGELGATILRLSESLKIIGLEGEICNALGVRIRAAFPEAFPVVLGYVNGWIGYLPTAKILREGGYEAVCSKYGEPFAETLEEALIAQLRELSV